VLYFSIMAPPQMPAAAASSPTATHYKGHCHCGALRYNLTVPRPLSHEPHSLSPPNPSKIDPENSAPVATIPDEEKEGGNSKTATEAPTPTSTELISESKPSTLSCNCSICAHNGYLLVHVTKDDLEITRGSMDDLKSYTFGKKMVTHRFCGTCGSSLFIDALDKFGIIAVNIRNLVDVDFKKLKFNYVDGWNAAGPPYELED